MGTNRFIKYARFSVFLLVINLLIALILIALILSMPFIELINQNHKTIVEKMMVFGIPVLIITTLTGTFNTKNPIRKNIEISVGTICLALFTWIALVIIVLTGFTMCASTNEKVLFYSKENKSEKIILRSFGCGATDSSPLSYSFVKTVNYWGVITIVECVDTNTIDKTKWERINR